MPERLQVLIDDDELRAIQQLARLDGLTTAEWVRQKPRSAREADARADSGRRLETIRRAASHAFPTGDIDQMLAEIERGLSDATG